MLKRILTALVGLAVFAAVIFSHRYVLYCAVTLVIAALLYEIYGAMGFDKNVKLTGYGTALLLCLGFVLNKNLFVIFAAVGLFMITLVRRHGSVKASEVLSACAVTLFVAVFMLSLVMIRKRCDKYTVILPFVCAWLTDTGAYFAGSFLGKHKLCPNISPKKTVEGAVGGLLLSTVGSAVYIIIMVELMAGGFPRTEIIAKFAAVGLAGSVIAQLGDLIASCIKRDFGKKDYGSALPGHGGFMDRFDSVIFVAPFVYYAVTHFLM